MKLTTKSEYSLLILIYLARAEAGRMVKLDEICATYDLSLKYAERMISLLKKHDFIRSRRGAGGGYSLAVKPGQVTMAEVIRLMDGPLAPTGAVSTHFHKVTPLEKEVGVIEVLKDIRDYTAHVVENKTLADLI